jgi:hypothetical protein
MTLNRFLLIALTLLMSGIAFNSNATVLSSNDGGLGVYDSNTNLTWTSDANLLTRLPTLNNLNSIITQEANIIRQMSGNTHNLSLTDFEFVSPSNSAAGLTGRTSWWGAIAFVGYLNSIDYGNSTHWALPTGGNANQPIAQQEQFFFNDLGHTYLVGANLNPLFRDIQFNGVYWSGTLTSTNNNVQNNPWAYTYHTGGSVWQGGSDPVVAYNFVWAVSTGNLVVPPVVNPQSLPEPGVILLMLTSLCLLGIIRRGNRLVAK